ncbi:hypothetical protein JANAI62_11930 [Jannaschia pagri]|uniref:Uncharacterized protein n=1 Tax=Jannaschia pagri TaxID=2829797 RepID=A0ABQ4NJH9_9RHOB|nr:MULTISPECIES: hypothetical protein [unclassified Jannaschia]GIT90738.1 hypothetical protein JANAI61_11960 [Jannaschia sp. AI_61]GIT94570.1 hypothetical protein JANAI62_11930 [Jannaschia sp. AI_62]
MSLISAIGPVQAAQLSNQGPGGQNTSQASTGAEDQTTSDAQPSGAANASGGSSAAETTQTNSQIAPVTASRASNAPSSGRPGSDGKTSVDSPQTADHLDIAFRPDLNEDDARRYAQAAQQRLITQELLSRIPVPLEAIPALTNEVGKVRDLEDGQAPQAYKRTV